MSERTFTVVFEQDDEWWVAWCAQVPGAITQGKTLDEARENLEKSAPACAGCAARTR